MYINKSRVNISWTIIINENIVYFEQFYLIWTPIFLYIFFDKKYGKFLTNAINSTLISIEKKHGTFIGLDHRIASGRKLGKYLHFSTIQFQNSKLITFALSTFFDHTVWSKLNWTISIIRLEKLLEQNESA